MWLGPAAWCDLAAQRRRPSHMETVNHGNTSRSYLRAFVDRLGVGSQVLIPADGEVLEF
ncbi:MAG: hypothetical protein J6D34_00305 [Atopobiaceae bacterium]|nr:hypothetical protein [Atopobiaceae bacterium]